MSRHILWITQTTLREEHFAERKFSVFLPKIQNQLPKGQPAKIIHVKSFKIQELHIIISNNPEKYDLSN